MLDCNGEEAAAVPADGVGQASRSVAGAEPFDVALGNCGTEVFITSGFLLLFNLSGLLAALFVLDDRNDLIVPTVFGEHPGGRRVTMRIDAHPRVRALLHQEANHFRQAIHDREVNWPMLVAVRHRHIGEFGANLQHLARQTQIVRANGIGKAANGDAINVCLELGPAFESIPPGENELGIMQAKVVRSARV